jgi:ABC-2 type transport system permease protein
MTHDKVRMTDDDFGIRHSALDIFMSMVHAQAIIVSRYPANVAAGLLVSFGGVLALALATRMFTPATSASVGALTGVMFYGYLLYAFLSDGLWRIGFSVRQDQVQGTLEGLYLTPAPKFASLVSRAVPLFALTATGAALALAAANWIFGGLPLANLGLGAVVFVCSLLGTFGLGFCFAAYTLIAGDVASSTGNFLEFGLLVVCAMLFPFSVLPEPVRLLSRLIPLSYCVDAFRSTLLGFPPGFPELAPFEIELIVVAAYALIAPVLGYALFRAVERRLRQTGRLGQY